MIFDKDNGMSDAEIIRLVREGATEATTEAKKDVGVLITCAQVLISHAVQVGATHQETVCNGFSVRGVPCGDWRLTIERIKP